MKLLWVKGDCGDSRSNILRNRVHSYSTAVHFDLTWKFLVQSILEPCEQPVFNESFTQLRCFAGQKLRSTNGSRWKRQGEESLFTDPDFKGDVAIGSCDVQGWRKPFKWVRAKQLHKMLVAIKSIFFAWIAANLRWDVYS